MYNVLQNNFENTIAREGITISTYISNQEFQAFFRRLNDGLNQRDTMTMFYPVGSPVHAGSIITLNDKQFILLNQESIENTVYNKSVVIRCNGTISTADAKVMNLPFYGSGASSAFPSSGGVSTKYIAVISGQTEIITEDCELARKLAINDKFNAWGRTWKIENIFYVDGIVTLNIEVQADEEITYTYDIRFTDIDASGYEIGDTVSLDAVPTINGNLAEGTLIYTSNNTDVATISENGVISFVGSGSVSFTIAWSEHEISKDTTETTIEEIQTDVVTLSVSAMEEIYMGVFDGECTATIKRNGETVHDIPFTAEATDCTFADRIQITVNQSTGLITAHVDDSTYNLKNLMNKRFTLLVSVPDYNLTDSQSVLITSL